MIYVKLFRKEINKEIITADINEYVINSEGMMAIKKHGDPDPIEFTRKFLGIAHYSPNPKLRTCKMAYELSEITAEVLDNIRFGDRTVQAYTIITDELGIKTCWSIGIEEMYFI